MDAEPITATKTLLTERPSDSLRTSTALCFQPPLSTHKADEHSSALIEAKPDLYDISRHHADTLDSPNSEFGGIRPRMSIPANSPFRPPTDAEIATAEQRLGVTFHPDYRAFLKGGGDVADATLEPAVILPGSGHLDLFEIAETAWRVIGVPRHLLPFIEDNGDYYCVAPGGGVVYWSHNGTTDEKWPTIAAWRQQVCVERR